jgi:hypothetical protein
MKQAGTINFRDATDSDEAVVIVRYDEGPVAICLSKQSNGDVEVIMNKQDAETLLNTLQKAIA